MLKGATIFYSVNLMNNLFLNMCQWNLLNLFDCVNKKKRLEATKLLFQQILLLNSVKYNFSLWLKSTKKLFFIFILCFGITIFRLDRKNCTMKNEKWIIFPKSQYVNSNPEYVKNTWSWNVLFSHSFPALSNITFPMFCGQYYW